MAKEPPIQLLADEGEIIAEFYLSDLDINQEDLSTEFSKQPSSYARYAVQLAQAERLFGKAAAVREQMYAILDKEYRLAAQLDNKKPTEPQLKALIEMDEDFVAVLEDELNAKYNYKVLKAIVDSWYMRADMLVSLGAHTRHEMDMVGMHINDMDAAVLKAKNSINKARAK